HERRKCQLLSIQKMSDRFKEKWSGANAVFAITRSRKTKDKRFALQKTDENGKQYYEVNKGTIKESVTTTYYVSSRKMTAKEALIEVRKHWGIENKLHWILDVAFREDDWTIKAKRVARNLAAI